MILKQNGLVNEQPKKIVYFPSLSSGAYASPLTKDLEVAPGVPYRFWDDRTPEEWRYKYFLMTAGHLYKKTGIRKTWGLEDSLVFGDSGGFQIATGALKWDLALRDSIFEWLEANSDIACNIDIPPRVTYEGRFQESLDISLDNFKYFEKKQSGKTNFLNVVQGSNPLEFTHWYNTVKDMQFGGWCIGSSRRLVDFMYVIAMMIKEKEFLKPYNTWVHLLGISKVSDFFILAQLQKLMNQYTGNKITVSTDSSSPGQYPIFGQMVWSPNWKDQVFNMLYFPKDSNSLNYPTTGHIPSLINHPGVKTLTWDVVRNYSTEAVTRLTYHNLYMYIYTAENAENLITSCPLEVLAELIPNDLIQILRSMEEMFNSPDPIAVYERYRQFYVKYGGENVMNIARETMDSFFDTSVFPTIKELKLEKKVANAEKKELKLQKLATDSTAAPIIENTLGGWGDYNVTDTTQPQ